MMVAIANRQSHSENHAPLPWFSAWVPGTDVLSFEYGVKGDSGVPFLGEIVISPATALCQALRWGSTHDRELRRLLVHGMLHLLGYDHTCDQGEHLAVQRRLLRRRFATCRRPTVERMKRR